MFTPITIEYYGAASRQGGRTSIDSTVQIDVVWDESVKGSSNPRYADRGIEVSVITFFEDQILFIDPKQCRVVKDNLYYEVIDNLPVPSDLGLEGTNEILLKKYRNQS
jgi:hypothetical protein